MKWNIVILLSFSVSSLTIHASSIQRQLIHSRTNLIKTLQTISTRAGVAKPQGNEFELVSDSIVASSLTGDFYQSRSGYAESICKHSSWCAWSDDGSGYKLSVNQDGYIVRETDSSLVLAVFDGISTAAGGEIATEVAINTVKHSDESLHQALDSIPAQLRHTAKDNTSVAFDFGIVAAGVEIFKDGRAVVSHVGDVRLLHIKDGKIDFHTFDHNPVYDDVINARMTADEYVSDTVYKGAVSRSLRASEREDTSIDQHEISLSEGDVLVIASDAVWNILTNTDVLKLIKGLDNTDAVLTLREVIGDIVSWNNKLDDNFTVIVYTH